MSKKPIKLNPDELEAVISSLLFTSSVSIIGTIDEARQKQLVDLATKLRKHDPDIKLQFIEFVKEGSYEDLVSADIYETFKDNMQIVTFDEA